MKSTKRLDIPPAVINSPDNMKRGIDIINQESRPKNILCVKRVSGMFPSTRSAMRLLIPIAKAMGIPIKKSTTILMKRMARVMMCSSLPLQHRAQTLDLLCCAQAMS
jgi:hypothetical protein